MELKIDINADVWEKAKAKLSSSQIASAMRMAINEGLTKGRTLVRRGIQDEYNIKASRINDARTGLSIKKAYGTNLTGTIDASHTPIPLKDMNPQFKGKIVATQVSFKSGKAKKGKAIKRNVSQISVEVIKGQRKTLETAFVPGIGRNATNGQQFATPAIFARGKRGKPGFEFDKPRYPIDTISSVSIATAAKNKRSLEHYEQPVTEYAQKRFVYHIERLIKTVDGLE